MFSKFLKFISRNIVRSTFFFLSFVIVIVSFFVYKKIQNRTKLDKKISYGESVNFLVVAGSDSENLFSLYIELFPKQKKIALFYINPYISIDEKKIKDETLPFLKTKLEFLIDKNIEYTFSIKENDFYRIIDILGGVEIFLDPSVYKLDKSLVENLESRFNSKELKNFLKLKESPTPLDYLERLTRQETITLTVLDLIYNEKKQIPKEWIYFFYNFFDTNLNANEIYFLFTYLTENKFATSVTEMSSEITEITIGKEKKLELKIKNDKVNIAYNKFISDFKSDDFGDGEFSRIEILNGTETAGLAKRAKNFLNDKRLKVLSTDNSSIAGVKESIIIDKSGNSEYIRKTSEFLGIKKIRHAIHKESGLDVTIILGEDFEIRKDKK